MKCAGGDGSRFFDWSLAYIELIGCMHELESAPRQVYT